MSDQKRIFVLVVAASVVVLLYLLSPVLTPFLIAALLAYLGDPLVDRMQGRLTRTGAVVATFAIFVGALVLALAFILPLLEQQAALLAARIPAYLEKLQTVFLPWLMQYLGELSIPIDLASIKSALQENWTTAGTVAGKVLGGVSKSGFAVMAWLANIVLIPVLAFYLLRDWDELMRRLRELVPRRYEVVTVRLARDSDTVLSAFLRGQLLVMLALSVVYSVGLSLLGLEFSLLIGALAGLLSFVPYLGLIIGFVVAGIVALFQFHEITMLLWIAGVFAIAQLLEGFVLTPYLVGDKIGLHPVAVIFAVMAGGQLFGFFGILLALPVAAVIMVILRYLHERYTNSSLYSNNPQ